MPRERISKRARTAAPPSPELTRDELQQRLARMSHERLVGLVLDLADADYELLRRVQRAIVGTTDAPAAGVHIRAEIDRALAVQYVDYRTISGFIGELDVILGEIRTLARTSRGAALDVAWYFLAALPAVFDAINAEDELQVFSDELVSLILDFASKEDEPLPTTAARLLRAFAADEYGYFGGIEDAVRKACRTAAQRTAIAAVAEEVAKGVSKSSQHVLASIAERLRQDT